MRSRRRCCAGIATASAAIDGFLDDYALLALALLDLYETAFRRGGSRMGGGAGRNARSSCLRTQRTGAFSASAAAQADLVLRLKDDYDGAEPSGNSVMALALLRLARMTGR